MAGDPFTSAIFTWLNRVASDGTLPQAAFKLAYIISQHINRKSRIAWPSQETLAEAMGLKSERSIRRLSEALEAGGHLLTTRRKQTSLVYRLAQDRTELSYLGEQEPTEGEPAVVDNPESRPDENVRSYDQDRTFLSSRPDIPVLKTGQECPPNHLNNHLRNQEVAKATPTKNKYSKEFEEAWQAYPRRLGGTPKPPAAKRFLSAVKAGTDPQIIIDAMKRFAVAESHNVGTVFIPQMIKWLNHERWLDYDGTVVPMKPNHRGHFV
jgi:hypothetical protein